MDKFGYLIQVLSCIGIRIFEPSENGFLNRFKSTFCNYCFPLLLHANAIFLCIAAFQKYVTYALILDSFMFSLPCVLWWMMRSRKGDMRYLILQLINFDKKNARQSSTLKRIVNILLTSMIAIQAAFLTHRIYQSQWNLNGNNATENHKKSIDPEFTHDVQFYFLSYLFAVLYFALCYSFLENFKHHKTMFERLRDKTCDYSQRILLREHLEVISCVEHFEDLFSTPAFVMVWQTFCSLSVSFLDSLYFGTWPLMSILRVSLETWPCLGVMMMVSFSAAAVRLEMFSVRRVLNDLKAASLFQNNQTFDTEELDLILNRDVIKLTAGNIVEFDRGFLLKSIGVLVAHAVIYYQVRNDS